MLFCFFMLYYIIKYTLVWTSNFFRSFQHRLGHSRNSRLILGLGSWDPRSKLIFFTSQCFSACQNIAMTLKLCKDYYFMLSHILRYFGWCIPKLQAWNNKWGVIAWCLAQHWSIPKPARGLHCLLLNHPIQNLTLFKFYLNENS